ncbi:MAG: dihydroneopterin aldolase [Fluviicola sp. XM-24bin1]|nr:MAG: dihydroneopterin aldolase [Fluviicola sp. XM-24bin1]
MKHTIEVNGIKLYAHHGCLPEEEAIGGHYIVDVAITTDFTEAMQNDYLNKTVDYVDVNRIVSREMAIRSKLIEHVGYRIVQALKSEVSGIDSLKVKVTKLTPPINGDVNDVAIIIEG